MSHEGWMRWAGSGRLFSLGFVGLFGASRCEWPQPPPDAEGPGTGETSANSDTSETRGSDTGTSGGTPAALDAGPDVDGSTGPDDGGGAVEPPVDGGATVCATVCPLRVDTHATSPGDGRDWSSAMNDLQLAIEQQSRAGGGEVWVRGGLVDVSRFTDGALHLASHVSVFGGFEGDEADPSERRTEAEPTILPNSWSDGASIQVSLSNIDAAHLDGFALGSGPLLIENSTAVLLSDLLFGDAYPMLSVTNSSVRVEDSVADQVLGHYDADILIDESNVAFVDTQIRAYDSGDALVTQSKVSLERFVGELEWLLDDTSQLLAVDARLRESFLTNGVITGGEVALVGSQVNGGGYGRSAISVRRILAYDTLFAFVGSGPRRGAAPRAGVIYGSKAVEVSFCTFFLNSCSSGDDVSRCYVDIFAADQINNSLFVHRMPNDPTIPAQYFAVGGRFAASNCATYDASLFDSEWLTGDVFAHTHPCPDVGDAHEGAASLVRLQRFTPPFLQPPFNVDLSRYDSREWWRSVSASSEACTDEGPPDPGEHLDVPCE